MIDLFSLFKGFRVSLVCVGNPLNGDDGVGPYIAEKLGTLSENTQVLNAETVPENFIPLIREFNPDRIIVVDAADFSSSAGELREIKADDIANQSISSHAMSLRFLQKYFQKHGKQVFFIGIQPRQTQPYSDLSPEVKETADRLCETIKKAYL